MIMDVMRGTNVTFKCWMLKTTRCYLTHQTTHLSVHVLCRNKSFKSFKLICHPLESFNITLSAILLSVISQWVTLLFSLAPEMFFFPIPSLHYSFGVTHQPKLYLNSECRLSDDFCLIIVSLSVSQELTLQWETESLRPRRLLQTWPWLIFTPWGELRRQIYLYSSLDMK